MKSFIVLIFLAIAGPSLSAHGDLHERIYKLSLQIRQAPDDVTLYLERGMLYNLHERFDSAAWDFQVVLRRIPDFQNAHLCLAEAYIGLGAVEQSMTTLNENAERYRTNYKWYRLRGETYTIRGQYEEAAADYRQVLKLKTEPTPQDYFDLAEALSQTGPDGADRAIEVLDGAEKALGWIITLKQYAIQLELERKKYDRALARTEEVIKRMQRKEKWLAEKGAILAMAGRREEALQAYQQALTAIAGLSPKHRNTTFLIALEKEIIEAVKRQF